MGSSSGKNQIEDSDVCSIGSDIELIPSSFENLSRLDVETNADDLNEPPSPPSSCQGWIFRVEPSSCAPAAADDRTKPHDRKGSKGEDSDVSRTAFPRRGVQIKGVGGCETPLWQWLERDSNGKVLNHRNSRSFIDDIEDAEDKDVKLGKQRVDETKISAHPRESDYLETDALISGSTKNKDQKTSGLAKAPQLQSFPSNNQAPKSWSLTSPAYHQMIPWNVSSSVLLTVTFRPAYQAVPEYTNVTLARDYSHRFASVTNSCSCQPQNSVSICGSCTTKYDGESYKGGVRHVDFYEERYTNDDIHRVKILELGDVCIKGWRGYDNSSSGDFGALKIGTPKSDDHEIKHSAIQIFLKPKHSDKMRCDLEGQSGGTAPINTSTHFASVWNKMGRKRKGRIQTKLAEQLRKSRTCQTFPGEGSNDSSNGSNTFEQEVEGNSKKHNDDGLPLPPWLEENNDEEVYGPIITFVIPSLKNNLYQQHQNQKDEEGITSLLEDAPPLLWKVQFPPDPSIALESLTVFDGILDVGNVSNLAKEDITDNRSINDHEEKDTRSSQSSYSDSSYSSQSMDEKYDTPTNIYINGYQSWSFAGSVDKTEHQPVSAMPDLFSAAFNRGATLPPHVKSDENNSDMKGNRRGRCGVWSRRDCRSRSSMNQFNDVATNQDQNINLSFYKSDFYTCITSNTNAMNEDYKNRRNKIDHLDEEGGTALVLGWLSQHQQYGLITLDSELKRIRMYCSLNGVIASRSKGIETDWAYCQILPRKCYDEEPMVHYFNAVAGYNNAKPFQNLQQACPPVTGWCSWYHYYENIDQENLKENFERLERLEKDINSDVAIVDDGYITAWGDWASLKKKAFPEGGGGMKRVADDIRSNGIMPGLWMAPFACDKKSDLARLHPDWIIRNDDGRIANSSNCGKFFYGLDATNPEVREYAFFCVRRAVEQWGYKVLKLDFLYAACLAGNGKYDLSMSRSETMHLALQTIRAAAGSEAFLIGCGCPIGPAIGYMDAMRISADTGPTWLPTFPLPWWDHGTLPSLRAMIRNSLTRSSLGHRWWHNDPDCLLIGETTSLTDKEVMSAATVVGMTGGMLLLSDDLSKLSLKRLQIATRIFPVTGVTAVPLDLHCTSISGLPSFLRMWCTDTKVVDQSLVEVNTDSNGSLSTLITAQNSRMASFSPDRPWPNPWARVRNCIPVAAGLGTWSVVAMSNWLEVEAMVILPLKTFIPPSSEIFPTRFKEHQLHCDSAMAPKTKTETVNNLGYHVFAFWSSTYMWIPSINGSEEEKTLSKKLGAHESEIFHVKPVLENSPQYIGSNLHFTCGFEVSKFNVTNKSIHLRLKNEARRNGYVYMYIPTDIPLINVVVNGVPGESNLIARIPQNQGGVVTYIGRVIRIRVLISGNNNESDGIVSVTY